MTTRHLRPDARYRPDRTAQHCCPNLPDDVLRKVELTPTRDAAHGDMASNAAMVAAKAAGRTGETCCRPRRGSEAGNRHRPGEPAGPGFVNITLDAVFRAQMPVILAPARTTATAPSATAGASTWNTFPPTRPGRCMSAIAGARWWVTRSPTCWPRPATTSPRSTTSTMPGRRSSRSPGRSTGATWRRSVAAHRGDIATVPGGMQYGGAYLLPIGAARRAYGAGARFAGGNIAAPEVWLDLVRDFAIAENAG